MARPLVDLLRHYAGERPEAPCLACDDMLLSFAALDRRSNQLANALLASGVVAGDRVAILDHTSITTFELFFACAKIGAILMPLNWRLSAGEIAAIVVDGSPVLVFVAKDLLPLLEQAPALPRIELGEPAVAWSAGASDAAPAVPVGADDPLLLLYTSGTTGTPKGVVLTNASHAYNGSVAAQWGFGPESVNLSAMPLFHIGGLGYGMMGLSQGGLTVLARQLDPVTMMNLMVRHGVTHTFLVPTVIQRLVEHAEAGVPVPATLGWLGYGAAPIGESILRRALAVFGCRFVHAYGMTETSGTIVSLLPEDHDPDGPHPERLRSCGRAMPWVDLVVIDPATERPAAPGEVGEIRVRSAMNMQGYWGKPEETAAALADGWLHTGDAAWEDAEGYLYIHDRYKDMIVSGGENIYPAEIENVLQAHSQVAEVAVIGTEHPRWGETPRAFVVPRANSVLTEAGIIAFARERLAHYKCPTSVIFVDALPRNAAGKLLKPELRRIDRQRK